MSREHGSAGILIRPMQPRDVEALVDLEQEIFSVPWSKNAYEKLLENPCCLYLVAEADDGIAGFAGCMAIGDEGDVDKVMVAAGYRGQGIAYALMQRLLAEGEARGITAFTLEVRVGNAPAIALYQKLGFVSEGVRPRFYEKPVEDALIMWRR